MLPVNDLGRHNGAIAGELREAIERVMRSGWFVLGPESQRFESRFAAYCQSNDCIGVANGTDALELALRALRVAPGDRVATVANAGAYATTAIRALGARPLYLDIEPATQLLALGALAQALRGGAKALIVTHLYGRMADMEHVIEVAKAAGVPVVEDCAQAHGARWKGRPAGSFGAAGCFSFYPTKNLGALGDGGAVVTGDSGLADRLRKLRQYGWSSKYHVSLPDGRNSRLDELQAAILCAKLLHVDGWNARRRAIAEAYSAGIEHPGILPAAPGGEEYVAHLYVVRAPRRDALRAHLASRGIATDIHYPIPDHRQDAFARAAGDGELPETERASAQVLTLPCFPEMSDQEVETVIAACNAWER
jgi:dTDP-4-amino-4,6-dideoxygalactose transaminase